MPATMGFVLASSLAITSPKSGDCMGLPNSVMSAPAKKVRPAQVMTIACTVSSARAAASAVVSPSRTAWLSALTGGLSLVMTAMPSSIV